MNFTEHNTYIVLDLPLEISSYISNIRNRFQDTYLTQLPSEITLTGSSGLGTISSNQSLKDVITSIEEIASTTKTFQARFKIVERFPNTDIFFFSLENEQPFINLHHSFLNSNIHFSKNVFPYKPHCTLSTKSLAETEKEEIIHLKNIQPFTLDSISLYSIIHREKSQVEVKLLHSAALSG